MLGADAGLDREPEFGGFKTQVILAHAGRSGLLEEKKLQAKAQGIT